MGLKKSDAEFTKPFVGTTEVIVMMSVQGGRSISSAVRLDYNAVHALEKAIVDYTFLPNTPQTDWHYDEQDATWYPYKHEDEPQQKSCATCKHALGNWDGESNNCERCCGADRRFYKPKTESQTERSK